MKVIIEGMPRPRAIDAMRDGGGYQSVTIDAEGRALVTEYRVDLIGHEPCGWQHPTWPNEATGRMQAHLQTCELRIEEQS